MQIIGQKLKPCASVAKNIIIENVHWIWAETFFWNVLLIFVAMQTKRSGNEIIKGIK